MKDWLLPDPLDETVRAGLPQFTDLQQALLTRRGIRSQAQASDYLNPATDRFGDPLQMLDMDRAVERLADARKLGEKVIVYGDYDADGVTATTLLVEALREAGIQSDFYIPDRFKEGYGLNPDAIRNLARAGNKLIITVDCGVRALKQVDLANDLGVDVIITDHHLPGLSLPRALAVIDPKRDGDPTPHKDYSGVGLAWKLASALQRYLSVGSSSQNLELVAIGTIADLVPLVGENREMVALGLKYLQGSQRPGLSALAEVAGVRLEKIISANIGFGLGPRINAAGRLDSASMAVELLMAKEPAIAENLAANLNRLNRERRRLTQEAVEAIQARLEPLDDGAKLIMEADPDYHEGVVGLVASRLVEAFYRPAIVCQKGPVYTKASARSIPEFHITDALEKCSALLERFGGHAAAAGFTVKTEQLAALQDKLSGLAKESLADLELREKIPVDAVVEFSDLNAELLGFLDQMEPFGQGNEQPILATFGADVRSYRQVGSLRNHLKMSLGNSGKVIDSIAFGMGGRAATLKSPIDLIYRFEWNEYMGVRTPQIQVLDFKSARI